MEQQNNVAQLAAEAARLAMDGMRDAFIDSCAAQKQEQFASTKLAFAIVAALGSAPSYADWVTTRDNLYKAASDVGVAENNYHKAWSRAKATLTDKDSVFIRADGEGVNFGLTFFVPETVKAAGPEAVRKQAEREAAKVKAAEAAKALLAVDVAAVEAEAVRLNAEAAKAKGDEAAKLRQAAYEADQKRTAAIKAQAEAKAGTKDSIKADVKELNAQVKALKLAPEARRKAVLWANNEGLAFVMFAFENQAWMQKAMRAEVARIAAVAMQAAEPKGAQVAEPKGAQVAEPKARKSA